MTALARLRGPIDAFFDTTTVNADSPAVKEFPASGRTHGSRAGPVRNASSAKCQPQCMLWEATVASLVDV